MLLKKKTRVNTKIQDSSMSDVAFLLLIFFLVTTIFNLEKGLSLVLPNSDSAPKPIAKENVCEIKIDPVGKVTLDGDPVQVAAIRDIVTKRILENDKTICVIETSPRTYYKYMVDVLDEIKLADARKITLRTGKQ